MIFFKVCRSIGGCLKYVFSFEGKGYTGQNIAYRSDQNNLTNWDKVIQDFYKEVSHFDSSAIDKFFSEEKYAHFTQVN